LLAGWGFRGAITALLALLAAALVLSATLLEHRTGIASFKPKFRDIFSKSPAINRLSAARFFLFASRDIWFVVALPVYLQSQLGWSYLAVGSLLALWVIAYGAIQGFAPRITGPKPRRRHRLHLGKYSSRIACRNRSCLADELANRNSAGAWATNFRRRFRSKLFGSFLSYRRLG
jgi:hypothetical protein